VKRLEDAVFKCCDRLTHVLVGEGVDYIEHGAFELCLKLEWVDLPNVHVVIEAGAFAFHGNLMIRVLRGHHGFEGSERYHRVSARNYWLYVLDPEE
jgi:hypothetical protein